MIIRHDKSLFDRVFFVGVVALLLTPLIFGRELLFPFVVYRAYVWYALVELLALGLLWRHGFQLFKRVFTSPILRAVTIFLLIKVFTDLAGLNPRVSLWGDYERMMGLITWTHWWLMIVVVSAVLNIKHSKIKDEQADDLVTGQKSRFEKLMWVTIAVGCIVTFYGLLQRFHPAFQIALADTRLFSTIGNAAVAAGFLLWPLFFSLYFLFAVSRSRYERAAALIALFILGYGLYLTATRGAMLGALLGLFIFFVFQLFAPFDPRRVKVNKETSVCGVAKQMASSTIDIGWHHRLWYAVALGIIVIAPLIIWFLRDTSLIASQAPLRRLTNISVADFTANSRLILWKIGFVAARDRWLTGYGEQMINIALDKHARPELVEQWFDSSHNAFLDILLAHGVIGFAMYFFLLYFVFRSIMRLRSEQPVMSAILSASVAAYLAQNFFLFDTLVVLMPFALVLAYLVAKEQKDGTALFAPAQSSSVKKMSVALASLFVIALFFYHLRALQALSHLTIGYRIVKSGGGLETALSSFRRGQDKMYFGFGNAAGLIRDSALFVFSRPFAYNSAELDSMRGFLREVHEKARKKEGEYSKYYVDEAKVFLQISPELGRELLPRAVMLLIQALEISPGRVDAYYALAETYAKAGDFARAKTLLADVIERFPVNADVAGKFLSEVEILEKK